jgi:hypothetical protein
MAKSVSCKKLIALRRKLIEKQVKKLLIETGASDASVSCFRQNGDVSCSLNLSYFRIFVESFRRPPALWDTSSYHR